jgi:hypothetical protein
MKTHNLIASMVITLQALFVTIPSVSVAGDLITVIVADTYDDSIGDSTSADLFKMSAMMSKIATNTEMKHKEVIIKDNLTTASNMLKTIKSLEVQEDDVVIFYFSGHGYRTPSKGDSLWPNLYFSLRDEGVEYEKVVAILQQKNPRLLLTVADVCNNVISEFNAPMLVKSMMFREGAEKKVNDNYRKLFLQTRGMVRITSSKAGEYSWATRRGGTFTLALLKNMEVELSSSVPADWGKMLDRTAYEVSKDMHPVYVIETTPN